VTIVVDDRGPENCLSEITVTQFDFDHLYATEAQLQTGRYWQITQNACAPGELFTVTLIVPLGTVEPDALNKLCRWTGTAWDCGETADHSIANGNITRFNIHEFSLWTIGSRVSPTALTVNGLVAQAGASLLVGPFVGLLVTGCLGLFFVRKRR
jgi:hypothetical protein